MHLLSTVMSLSSLLVVFGGAVALCVPSLCLLYALQQREELDPLPLTGLSAECEIEVGEDTSVM
jgi:hypothetical protein